MGVEVAQQPLGFVRALRRGLFQPMPGLLRFMLTRLAVQPTQLQLSPPLTRTRGLAQQLEANPAVTSIAAVTTEQLPQTTLRDYHTLAGRLLEQTYGETLDTDGMSQPWAVQQPECYSEKQTWTSGGWSGRQGE